MGDVERSSVEERDLQGELHIWWSGPGTGDL